MEYAQFYSKPYELSGRDGKFSIEYLEPKNPRLLKYHRAISESDIFSPLAESLNELLYFENDHTIFFTEGGSINAYFDPSDQNITIHYELMEYLYKRLHEKELNAVSDTEELLIDSTYFVIIHELGHALLDIFNLQFIGKEEDLSDHLFFPLYWR